MLPASCASPTRSHIDRWDPHVWDEAECAARLLLCRHIIVRARLKQVQVLSVLLLVASWLSARPVCAAGAIPPAACPGYVAHLQRARSFLADGNRAAALDELEHAKEALGSCVRGVTDGEPASGVG